MVTSNLPTILEQVFFSHILLSANDQSCMLRNKTKIDISDNFRSHKPSNKTKRLLSRKPLHPITTYTIYVLLNLSLNTQYQRHSLNLQSGRRTPVSPQVNTNCQRFEMDGVKGGGWGKKYLFVLRETCDRLSRCLFICA